ncbi:hypothetical protein QCA50_007561 [Cerrena zonata]|uniref:Cytochrome P450 n=1 Tax=Cerrena zonata TaxID=2478898 RepID=A0AAW0G836_9APHY
MPTILISVLISFVIGIAFTVVVLRKGDDNHKRLPLPPGPSPLPIVGNLFDMPRESSWTAFAAMSRKYGDIMHLKAINQHIIVVSSSEVAADLFEKRAAIYSDRYQSVMMTDLMEIGWSFTIMDYNEEWRKKRKVFHQYLGANAIRAYDNQQFDHVREFLRQLHRQPEKSSEHAHFLFSAILMDTIYGIPIADITNIHVAEAEKSVEGFNEAIEPGRFWVDFLPLLKYVPDWFPGANFQRLAADWRLHMFKARDGPFYETKSAYTAGSARPSVVATILEDISDDLQPEQERIINDSVGTAFAAGVNTSAPTLQIFLFAMLTNLEVQRKAQAELDAVVGRDRLPTLNDKDNLPIIEAILRETLRWMPVVPLAIPHYTSASDEYRGYYIPKGSIVIGNSWHILHNPDDYPEPELFKPERYLAADGSINPDVMDPSASCFGYGRRICPGRFLSLNALFLAMACTLHVFNIEPEEGPDGTPLKTEIRMTGNFIPHPKIPPCSVKERPEAEVLFAQ